MSKPDTHAIPALAGRGAVGGVLMGLAALMGWAQTLVLALRIAPSFLGCYSVLHSALLSLGITGMAVGSLYVEQVGDFAGWSVEQAGWITIGGGMAIFILGLIVGRGQAPPQQGRSG